MTRDQANEHQARQLADFLIGAGLLGVRTQGDVVTYPLMSGDLVILQVRSAPIVPDQKPLAALVQVVS